MGSRDLENMTPRERRIHALQAVLGFAAGSKLQGGSSVIPPEDAVRKTMQIARKTGLIGRLHKSEEPNKKRLTESDSYVFLPPKKAGNAVAPTKKVTPNWVTQEESPCSDCARHYGTLHSSDCKRGKL